MLSKGAGALTPTGKVFDQENIAFALEERNEKAGTAEAVKEPKGRPHER